MRTARVLVALLAWTIACAAEAQAQAEPPPIASEGEVTRADAEALFAALADANRREDVAGVTALYAGPLATRVRAQAVRLFQERNYFSTETRIESAQPRAAGGLEVEVVQVFRSRPVHETSDRREKARWRYGIARVGGAPRIVESREAEPVRLPVQAAWTPERWTGRLVLSPAPRGASGTLAVELDLVARHVGPAPSADVPFLLHAFTNGLDVRQGAAALPLRRVEGPVDVWTATLPAPVEPGGTVALHVTYVLDETGAAVTSSIAKDDARLLPGSAWLPVLRPSGGREPEMAEHDFVVETPEGLAAAMPGRLASDAALEGGRHEWRWVSERAGGDLLLVAGRWRHDVLPVADGFVVHAFVRADRDAAHPARLADLAVTAARFLERITPHPVSSVTVADGSVTRLVGAPQIVAVPDASGEWTRDAEKEESPTFFMAHHLAHAWVVDGATDPPPPFVTEGLCDHLASTWSGEQLDPALPEIFRGSILGGIGEAANVDRPLVGSADAVPYADVFGSGKAMLAFEGWRRLAGDARWREGLAKWMTGPRTAASLLDALSAGDATLKAYVESFFLKQGLTEPRVEAVRLRELSPAEASAASLDAAAWKQCEIVVENPGLLPVPLRVQIDVDAGRQIRDVVMDGEHLVVTLPVVSLPTHVRLDPDRILWQSSSMDDVWPPHPSKPKRDWGHRREGGPPSSDDQSPWRDPIRQR